MPSSKKSFWRHLKKFDIFGKNIQLTYAGKEAVSTSVGTVLSLVFMSIIFAIAVYDFKKIWNADTSSIITQLNYITDEENLSINIKLSDLSFGFGFEDDLPASVGNLKLSYVNSIAGANSTNVVIGT
jgi:hypothetical protein